MSSNGMAKGFIFLAAFLTGSGWLLSACGRLNWTGGVCMVGLGLAVWIARRQYPDWQQFGAEIVAPFKSLPAAILLGLILVSAVIYSPALLDSLTYRLPRILIWLEHGGVHQIAAAEPRLNYMAHVWELCTAPLLVLGGVRWSWLWSALSWLVCQTIFYRWGLRLGQNPTRSHNLALLTNTSTFAVLQAANTSNDLMAATLLLLALDFIWEYELHRQPGAINWAGLSLALCSGVKPHFAVMGLPFLLWFFLASSRPWRSYPWRLLPLVLPVLLLCSAATSFALNYTNYGRITGPDQGSAFQGSGPVINVLAGSVMMGWQALQPSINPAAFALNKPLEEAVAKSGIRSVCPRFGLEMHPLSMTDHASLGLILLAWALAGCWIGLRRNKTGWGNFFVLAFLAGLFGFVASVSQFLPTTLGRSYLAFCLLGLPLAWSGWRHFSDSGIRIGMLLAVGMAVLALVSNPARPLWPVKTIHGVLAKDNSGFLKRTLDSYVIFRERAEAGRGLADQVPSSEPFFVVLIASDRPLLPVLTSRHGPGKVRLLPAGAAVADLQAVGPRYVLLCDRNKESYPELVDYLQTNATYRVVATAEHVTRLARGSGTWTLYAPNPSGTPRDMTAKSSE